MLEWYEDLYEEKLDLERLLDEGLTGEALSETVRRLENIHRVLELADEHVKTGDPLVDYWESEIAAGRTPDLDMKVEDIPNG